jgi:photosystem II stability/assembly factor-like uncharacterized protein
MARVVALLVCASYCELAPARAAPGGPLGWHALGGPAGQVSELAVNPRDRTQIYAVSSGRALYQSRDGGITWQPATNDLPPGQITAIYADPIGNGLYAAVEGHSQETGGGHSLWFSRDGASTWESVPLGRADLAIRSIIRNADGHYLFLALEPVGADGSGYVYRSPDNGATWERFEVVGTGKGSNRVLDLVAHPSMANRLFVTTSAGHVYRSVDSGQTWQLVADDIPSGESAPAGPTRSIQLALDPDQPDAMFLLRGPGERRSDPLILDRSIDGGTTWQRSAAAGLPARGVAAALFAASGNILLSNTGSGTYRSTDGGASWRLLEGPLSGGGATRFVALPRSRTELLVATGSGLYFSRDAGAFWQPASSGWPANGRIVAMATNPAQPGQVYALTAEHGAPDRSGPSVMVGSQDGGQNWKPFWQGLPAMDPVAWAFGFQSPAVFYVATPDQFIRTLDRGITWQTSRAELVPDVLAAAPSDPTVVYLAGHTASGNKPALMRSTDAGATWQEMMIMQAPGTGGATAITGLAVDPTDANHAWAALPDKGIYERTGSGAWANAGLGSKPLRWLAYAPGDRAALYAGVDGEGIYRRVMTGTTDLAWVPSSTGLPNGAAVVTFLADDRAPGALWAALQGGSVYHSTNYGDSWSNMSQGLGDNQVRALAVDYRTPGGILAGTEQGGVWSLRPNGRPAPTPEAVDARIEIVWPHDGKPVTEARQVNVGLRLFLPNSLVPSPCSWAPKVTVLQAIDTDPAAPLGTAKQRSVNGQPYPYWELNDVDVRVANNPEHKVYYLVQVAGSATQTSVWAHGSDPRTYFPQQDVPSGIATDAIDAVDARIQIVWPHDGQGNEQPVDRATYANVAVALFKHGTRLSVPLDWQPQKLALYGAWNQQIGQPLATEAVRQVRQAGAITYPVWEFHNVPVGLAADPANKLFLWVMIGSVQTYPTVWTHGADGRTYFPAEDEPIQGCSP